MLTLSWRCLPDVTPTYWRNSRAAWPLLCQPTCRIAVLIGRSVSRGTPATTGRHDLGWHRDFVDARQRLRDWVIASGMRLDRDRPTRQTVWPGEEPAALSRTTRSPTGTRTSSSTCSIRSPGIWTSNCLQCMTAGCVMPGQRCFCCAPGRSWGARGLRPRRGEPSSAAPRLSRRGWRPGRPVRGSDERAVLERGARAERGAGAAVVEHLCHVGDPDRRADVIPEACVAVADLLLRHGMAAAADPLRDALHGELDGDDDHVQVHEVAHVHGIGDEPDLARVREHRLGDEGFPGADPGPALGLGDLRGFVGVLGLGVRP